MSNPHPTWADLAIVYPQFVQWVVQRDGPLSDGPILQEDYERLTAAYAGRSDD